MKADTLTVLVVEPEQPPYVKSIEDDLRSLQAEVGGSIEAIYPFDDPVAIICNEEGKMLGLPLNRALRDEDHHVYDVVAGTFLVAGLGAEDFCSLNEKQIEKYSEHFKTPELFLRINGRMLVIPIEESLLGTGKRILTTTKKRSRKRLTRARNDNPTLGQLVPR